MEDAVATEVNNTMDSENIHVDWSARPDLDEVKEYVEKWRILVWDRAYFFLLRKNNGYSRTSAFKDHDGTANAVKRLMYRY